MTEGPKATYAVGISQKIHFKNTQNIIWKSTKSETNTFWLRCCMRHINTQRK